MKMRNTTLFAKNKAFSHEKEFGKLKFYTSCKILKTENEFGATMV